MKDLRFRQIAMIGLACMPIVLAGCSLTGGSPQKSTEKKALKVMFYDERSFYSQLGLAYSAVHPDVDVTVVTNQQNGPFDPNKDPEAELEKFVDKEQPDVVMLTPDQLTKFAGENRLLELDTVVQDKNYHQETLIPGYLDYMKGLTGGKLYGLSPIFYSQVVFYNKDLFNKYGISPPTDKMSWDQMIQLAQRFPTDGTKDSRVYGLSLGYTTDLYQLGSLIGSSENLSTVNPATKQVTINTPAWKKVFQTALSAMKSGTLYSETPTPTSGSTSYEDYLLQDPFIAGMVGMVLQGGYYLQQIKEAQTRAADKAIKNWDIVTMPVDPNNPDSTSYMSFNQIYAVNAKSVNADTAKEFIRYVTSEDYARLASKLQDGTLPVRTAYIQDDGNHNMKAFYSLKPSNASLNEAYSKLPQSFLMSFFGMAQQKLKEVPDGKASLDQALADIQTQGQQELQKALADEANKAQSSQSGSGTGAG
ncbi:ABC transporter substrate-binding protein [Paenibacillus humicola]|uniref:ABC transporter substrate-binding protein n=1 Tax=Paenibacillus humicola TaxID=3110540 RepID=UPI00237A86A6|nr:ABC transporter substrate-binding protein [Paenibacillus humicola]